MFRHPVAMALLALGMLGASAPAQAQSDGYAAPGGYLFLGGLNAFQNFPEIPDMSLSRVSEVDNAMGFDIRAGWRVMDFLAFELEGNFIGGFDFDVETLGGPAGLTLQGGNVTGNIKGVLPLGRFQPYALVGIGGMWADVVTRFNTGTVCSPGYFGWWCTGTRTRLASGGGFVAKFGAGTDFWVTEDWGITMDAVYVLPTGDIENLQYVKLSWGVKFKF